MKKNMIPLMFLMVLILVFCLWPACGGNGGDEDATSDVADDDALQDLDTIDTVPDTDASDAADSEDGSELPPGVTGTPCDENADCPSGQCIDVGGDHKVWLNAEWQAIFERLSAARLPVLWHVTQRHTVSPYTGGGLQSYWTEAWEKGLTCTNQDLLDVFLELCNRWPDIPFIGAHQLHVGFDKLDELLPKYPNLYIDTSCGCFVRWGDRLYKPDRRRGRDFFCRHAERIRKIDAIS